MSSTEEEITDLLHATQTDANQITMKQYDHEYPVMTIMVTNNPIMRRGKLTARDKEHALEVVGKWLDKALAEPPRWKRQRERPDLRRKENKPQ
jgi:hypothetical protein